MIVDRKTFIATMVYERGIEEHLVFMPETDPVLNPKKKRPAQWFVNCPIIKNLYIHWHSHSTSDRTWKSEYWSWCDDNLQGAVYCYWESDTDQWWGFENKDDIFLWSLKWL